MYIYIYIYVCIYVCMYVCIHAHELHIQVSNDDTERILKFEN